MPLTEIKMGKGRPGEGQGKVKRLVIGHGLVEFEMETPSRREACCLAPRSTTSLHQATVSGWCWSTESHFV